MKMLDYKDIAKIFEEMELRLIASLKRNLSRHKAEEQKEGFKWSAWQAEKLKNIDKFRKENQDILGEYIDVIDKETRQLMIEQFREGEQVAEQSVIEASEKGANILNTPTAIPSDHFFGVNTPKMKRLMDDITTLEKTVETAAVRNMNDVYRTTLNRVQLMMGSGSLTLTEAIDLATREFLDKGINCIVYAGGRRVNIADYVRMALRTTFTRATLQGAAKRFAELGYDTVLISQYGGCSETCEPYQGKVYIDDVFTIWNGEKSGDFGKSNYCDKCFMLLSVAIRGGLFHPNCRHTMGQYIDGLTKIPKPIPAEKIKEQRALEEKQRAMERSIRALKRKAEGTQDEKKVKEYKRKLREEQGKLREFIKEHDDVLRRDYSREKIYSGEGKPKQAAPRTEEAPMSKLPENTTPQLPEVTQDSPKAKKIMSEGVDNSSESGISGKFTSSTGENTVDLEYINSDEYKQKFDGLTGEPKVDKQLYSQAVAQLTHRNGTYGEDLTLINAKTGTVEGRQSNSSSENGVEYNSSLNKAIADNPPYSLISIHNHPTNNPPTGSDLASNGGRKYKLGVVVTHDGRVFTYKAGNKPFLAKSFDNTVDKNRSKGYNEYEAIVETLKQYQRDYGIEWSER
nr:MAG TPA: minor capsid protein [Caudoviricetes sp.]